MPKFNLNGLKKYTIFLTLVFLMVFFSLISPYFLTVRNLINIVTQNTYFIIAAVGLSFVMIGGGIDLSVGYQMSLVGVVTAMSMVVYHQPVWLSVKTTVPSPPPDGSEYCCVQVIPPSEVCQMTDSSA